MCISPDKCLCFWASPAGTRVRVFSSCLFFFFDVGVLCLLFSLPVCFVVVCGGGTRT